MADKKEMTVAEAWRILTQSSSLSPDYEKACKFLQANYPDLWAAYEKYGSALVGKEEKQKKETEVSARTVARNHEEIEKLAAEYDYEQFKAQDENKQLLANVDVLDDTQEGKPASVVEQSRQGDYMSLLFAAAKMKAHISLLGDQSFARKKNKEGIYRDCVNSIFYTDLARAGVASAFDIPNEKELQLDSKDFKAWVERNAQKARDVLGRFLGQKERVTVRTSAIATSLGASQAQVDLFVKRMQERADKSKGNSKTYLQAVAEGFKLNLSKIGEAIKQAKNKPFEEKVKTARDFFREAWSNNKAKIITNSVVAVAFTAGFLANPVIAAAGLGAYMAAGGWGWPVYTERKKIQNDARKAGKPVPSNAEARAQAWKNLNSEERRRSYLAQGIASTVLGGAAVVALPALVGMGAAGAVAGLTAGKMARVGAPAVGQLADASITSLTRPYDPVAQANAQVTALSALGTLGLSALTSGVMDMDTNVVTPNPSALLTDTLNQADTPNVAMPVDTLAQDTVTGYVPGSSEQELNDVINSLSSTPEETTPQLLDFPDQYTPASGLTPKQFNTLVRTSPGVFGPLAQSAGMTNAQYMDLIYTNIHQHMDKFPGLTEEQVLYDANRMIAFHAKAVSVGGGFLDNIDTGADHLNNEFSHMSFFKNNWSEDKIAAFAEDMQYYTYSSKKEVLSALEASYSDVPLATRQAVCDALVGNRVAYVNGEQIETLQAMIMGCNPDDRYIQSTSNLVTQHVNSHYDYLKTGNGTNRYIGGYGTDENCGKGIGSHRWQMGEKVNEKVVPPADKTPPTPVVEQTPPTPVVEQTPPTPVVEQTPPPPVVEQTPPPPVVEQTPPPPPAEQTPPPPPAEQTPPPPPAEQTPPPPPAEQTPPPPSGKKVTISRKSSTHRFGSESLNHNHGKDARMGFQGKRMFSGNGM